MPRARAFLKTDAEQARWRVIAQIGLACAVYLVWLPGCASVNDTRAKPGGDPLFGEKQVERPPIGPTPPPQNRAGMNVPPPPTTTAAKSTAAIIANPPDQLTTTRPPLSIGESPSPTQTAGGWQPKTDGQPTGAGGPGVQLKTPETPAIQPVPPPTIHSVQPVPTIAISGAGAPSDAALLAALKARGMVWNTQTPVAGGVRFSCGIADPQNPGVIQAYDATAADAPSAMNAVLQKLQ
jgi:hypothetical protein